MGACRPNASTQPESETNPRDSIGCTSKLTTAKALIDSSKVLRKRGASPEDIVKILKEAIEKLKDCPDPTLTVTAYHRIAYIEKEDFGHNYSAILLLKKATNAAAAVVPIRLKDSLAAMICDEAATLYMMLGYQDSGYFYASKAVEIKTRLFGSQDRRTAISMTNLAQALSNIGEYERVDSLRAAILAIRLAFPSEFRANNHGVAYSNCADSRMLLGDLAGAERFIQLAYTALAQIDDQSRHLSMTLETEAQIAFRKGDFPRAAFCIGRACSLITALYQRPHREIGVRQNTAAEVQLLLGQPDSALALFHDALLNFCPLYRDTARTRLPATWQFGREPHTFSALAGKAHAWEALGRPDSAASCYRSAFAFSDHLRRNFSTVEEQRHLMRMNFPEFERAIRMSFRAGRSAEVFEWIERSKANDLLDELTQLGAAHPELLPEEAMEHGRAFGDSLADAHAQQDLGTPGAADAVQRWRDSLDAFNAHVQRTHPGLLPSDHSFQQIKTLQAENVLPDSALFISYFVGDSSLYISAFNGWRDTCVIVPDLLALQRDIRCLLQTLQAEPDNAARAPYIRCAHAIYQALVAPVLPIHAAVRRSPRRLLIAPDGALSFIPFAALLDAPAPASAEKWGTLPYMVRHWNINYVNSGTHMARLKEMARDRKPGVLPGIYGLGTDGSPSQPLPSAELEVIQAVEIMGGIELLKEAASEGALKRQRTNREILHLSSHGIVNDSFPLLSYVDLRGDSLEDGRLHAYEVFKLNLGERMAVLNACRTGVGQMVRGQGVISMGYAFQVAHCPTIVMSLWNIDDEATRKVFTNFYAELAQSKPAANALHSATLAYLDDEVSHGDDFKHPGYWAPFVMVGNGEQVFEADPRPWWVWLLWFAPLPLTIALIWFWRRRQRGRADAWEGTKAT
jgi:CHAT domain-containing protein